MNQEVFHLLLLAGSFLALFGFAELLYHKLHLKTEITRKIVHIGTGLLTLLFPVLLSSHWSVLLLCGSFLIILLGSLKYGLLPSINAIDRVSHGSILYPVAVYGCYLLYSSSDKGLIMFYLPILVLAFCDPVAAFVGKRFPAGRYQVGSGRKTLSGSAAFFAGCLAVAALSFYFLVPDIYQSGRAVSSLLLLSLFATISESVSGKGSDNLTIPASVALSLNLIL